VVIRAATPAALGLLQPTTLRRVRRAMVSVPAVIAGAAPGRARPGNVVRAPFAFAPRQPGRHRGVDLRDATIAGATAELDMGPTSTALAGADAATVRA
jgi:hypothetical protein